MFRLFRNNALGTGQLVKEAPDFVANDIARDSGPGKKKGRICSCLNFLQDLNFSCRLWLYLFALGKING
jgi:hypothetical protein